jgi:hypothetical protein
VFARITNQAAVYGQNDAYKYYTRMRDFSHEPLEGQSQIVGDYVRYKEFGIRPTYQLGGKPYTIPVNRLEMWAKGSALYGGK